MPHTRPLLLCLLIVSACTPAPWPHSPARGRVTFALTRQGAPAPVGVKVGGMDVEVEGMFVVISDIELHLCEEPAREAALGLELIPSAWAHVPRSATRLGTPVVEDWLGEPGKTRAVGEVAPPLGHYCGVWVVVAPADRDIMNPTGIETQGVLGKSVVIRGRKKREQDTEWTPFEISAALQAALPVSFRDPETHTPVLVLGAGKPSAFLRITKTLDLAFWQRPEMRKTLEQGVMDQDVLTALGSSLALIPPTSSPQTPGTSP